MKIKGIKIDAINRTITEIELPTKPGDPDECCGTQVDSKALYAAVGSDTVTMLRLGKKNYCVIDDNALLAEPAPVFFWQWGKDGQPIANGGVIASHDVMLDAWSDATISLETALKTVIFTRRKVRGMRCEASEDGGTRIFKETLIAPIVEER